MTASRGIATIKTIDNGNETVWVVIGIWHPTRQWQLPLEAVPEGAQEGDMFIFEWTSIKANPSLMKAIKKFR